MRFVSLVFHYHDEHGGQFRALIEVPLACTSRALVIGEVHHDNFWEILAPATPQFFSISDILWVKAHRRWDFTHTSVCARKHKLSKKQQCSQRTGKVTAEKER